MLAVEAPCSALRVVYVSFDRPKRLGNPSRSRGRTTQNSSSRPLQTSLPHLCISLPVTASRICTRRYHKATATTASASAEALVFSGSEDSIILGYDTTSLGNRPRNVEKYFSVTRRHIAKEGNPFKPLQ